MKVYVASKFQNKENVRQAFKQLEASGHTITADWTQHDLEGKEPSEIRPFLEACASQDFEGVMDAEVLILIPDKQGGAHFTEMGIAMGRYTPVIVVGLDSTHARNIFYYHTCLWHVKTIQEAIDLMATWEAEDFSGTSPEQYKLELK